MLDVCLSVHCKKKKKTLEYLTVMLLLLLHCGTKSTFFLMIKTIPSVNYAVAQSVFFKMLPMSQGHSTATRLHLKYFLPHQIPHIHNIHNITALKVIHNFVCDLVWLNFFWRCDQNLKNIITYHMFNAQYYCGLKYI